MKEFNLQVGFVIIHDKLGQGEIRSIINDNTKHPIIHIHFKKDKKNVTREFPWDTLQFHLVD